MMNAVHPCIDLKAGMFRGAHLLKYTSMHHPGTMSRSMRRVLLLGRAMFARCYASYRPTPPPHPVTSARELTLTLPYLPCLISLHYWIATRRNHVPIRPCSA